MVFIYYIGTGKAEHGLRITAVLDGDSRFVLGYSVGSYHKEKSKKGEKHSELEKMAIASANERCREYGLSEVTDPGKSNSVSSFFSSLNTEFLMRFAYENENELREIVDRYLEFYNFKRVHSGLKYKVPYDVLMGKK